MSTGSRSCCVAVAAVIAVSGTASAAPTFPDDPRPGHVADTAVLLDQRTTARVEQAAVAIEGESGARLLVVTIPSLAAQGGTGPLRSYARDLIAWRQSAAPSASDRTILLLVSKTERDACIELGAGWGTAHRAHVDAIADLLVPRLRGGLASEGILDAVQRIRGWVGDPDGRGGGGSIELDAFLLVAVAVLSYVVWWRVSQRVAPFTGPRVRRVRRTTRVSRSRRRSWRIGAARRARMDEGSNEGWSDGP